MKIVFFTNKCSHGAKMLRALQNNNIKITAIIVESPKESQKSLPIRFKRKLSNLFRLLKEGKYWAIIESFRASLVHHSRKVLKTAPWKSNEYYHTFSNQVFVVGNFNDKNTENLLSNLEPELTVLGGSRILKQHIISIPQIGILNAHPGLLPKYRGVDVIPWAILNGDLIGVTVHFIDRGVDTGSILLQEELTITKSDTIKSLKEKAEDLAAALMVKTIIAIRNGEIEPIPQKRSDGEQYYRMTRETYRRAQKRLKAIQWRM